MNPLLTAALHGTANHSGAAVETGTPVDDLTAAMAHASRERAILLATGAAAIYRMAGRVADDQPAPAPCGEESRRTPSLQATRVLADLFDNAAADLLPEAMALLDRAGCHLPHHLLPEALARDEQEIRRALLPVLGVRGRWLAAFNPAWHWARDTHLWAGPHLPADAETIWQEGSLAQRREILAMLRRVDPERARAWLSGTWRDERAETRSALLDTLDVNLSLEDEPLLEMALDDRSAKVRKAAIPLLARLPGSALAGRMRARADSLVVWAPAAAGGGAEQGAIHIHVPAIADPVWRRDTNNSAPAGPGLDAYPTRYLIDTLALIPPAYWSHRFGSVPDRIIAAAARVEQESQLRDGLARAALLHRDSTWAGPLWNWQLESARGGHSDDPCDTETMRALLALLPQEEAERRVAPLFGDPACGLPVESAIALIAPLSRPWGEVLSDAALDGLEAVVREVRPRLEAHHGWVQSLATIACGVSPSRCGRALNVAAPAGNEEIMRDERIVDWRVHRWREALATFRATIERRQRLYRELST